MRSMILFCLICSLFFLPLCGCNQEDIARQMKEIQQHIDKANEQLQRLEVIAKAFKEAGIGIENAQMREVTAAIAKAKAVGEAGQKRLEDLDTATGSSFPVLGVGGGTLGSIITGIGLIISVVKNITKSKQVVNLKTELKATTDGLDSVIRAVNPIAGIGAKIKEEAPRSTPGGEVVKARYNAVITPG